MDKEFYDKYGKELDCKSCIGLQECSTNSNIPLCDKGYRRFAKDKIAELEQELAELKEKDNYHLRYELAGADETITNLKKQLEEKDKDKTQLAIQELEKVKDYMHTTYGYDCCADVNWVDDFIDQQIKLLKGEKDVED